MCVCVYAHVGRLEVDVRYLPSLLSNLYLEVGQCLSWNQDLPFPLLSALRFQMNLPPHLGFNWVPGESQSSLHACSASSLSTEPFQQPYVALIQVTHVMLIRILCVLGYNLYQILVLESEMFLNLQLCAVTSLPGGPYVCSNLKFICTCQVTTEVDPCPSQTCICIYRCTYMAMHMHV